MLREDRAAAKALFTLVRIAPMQPYGDEGAAAYEKRYQEARIKSLTAAAKGLGYQLTPNPSISFQ